MVYNLLAFYKRHWYIYIYIGVYIKGLPQRLINMGSRIRSFGMIGNSLAKVQRLRKQF